MRENQKGVQFTAEEHREIFRSVAEIYCASKVARGITSSVPVILAEYETKVKSRVCGESKDSLSGFCGVKANHICDSRFTPHVGEGEAGYNVILYSCPDNIVGGCARVVMVNPLYERLPRLVLVVSYTYNQFESDANGRPLMSCGQRNALLMSAQ